MSLLLMRFDSVFFSSLGGGGMPPCRQTAYYTIPSCYDYVPGIPKENSSCCPLRPHNTPYPEGKSILGVIYGVLLWADMNAATPLGTWGRSIHRTAKHAEHSLLGAWGRSVPVASVYVRFIYEITA